MTQLGDISKYETLIPPRMMASIMRYLDKGAPMGGFLTALFCNDLQNTYARADDENKKLIPIYLEFLHWEIPANAHGDPDIMATWMKDKRHELGLHPDAHERLTD